jgi:hypothetical protein
MDLDHNTALQVQLLSRDVVSKQNIVPVLLGFETNKWKLFHEKNASNKCYKIIKKIDSEHPVNEKRVQFSVVRAYSISWYHGSQF